MKRLGTVNQNQDKEKVLISEELGDFFQRKLFFFIQITCKVHILGLKSFKCFVGITLKNLESLKFRVIEHKLQILTNAFNFKYFFERITCPVLTLH